MAGVITTNTSSLGSLKNDVSIKLTSSSKCISIPSLIKALVKEVGVLSYPETAIPMVLK